MSEPAEPTDHREPSPAKPAQTAQTPSVTLANRLRLPLGLLATVIGLGLAVVFAIRPLSEVPGAAGAVQWGSGIVLWLAVAAAGLTWALNRPGKITNLCAGIGLLAYLVMLVSGL